MFCAAAPESASRQDAAAALEENATILMMLECAELDGQLEMSVERYLPLYIFTNSTRRCERCSVMPCQAHILSQVASFILE